LIQSNAPLSTKVDNNIEQVKNPGDSVYTTLDVDIQKAADKASDKYNSYTGNSDSKKIV